MGRYKLNGTIVITHRYIIDETVEADSEDDAIDAVCEELDPDEAFDSDTDVLSLDIILIGEDTPYVISEAERMRQLGAPLLPGFELV